MNAPDRLKASFKWDDPLLLDEQLTDEERMVRDTAHATRRRSCCRGCATRFATK